MKRLINILLACMLISGMLLGIIPRFSEEVMADPPPPNDDVNGTSIQYIEGTWTVSGSESYSDEIIILSGNLIVPNSAVLTLRNTTLMMNCSSNGQYRIEVQNGGLLIITDKDGNHSTTNDASNITDKPDDVDDGSADGVVDFRYKFRINSGGSLYMNNSILRECGYSTSTDASGLYCEYSNWNPNFMLDNNTIDNCYYGVYNYGVRYTIFTNNKVNNCNRGFYQRTGWHIPLGNIVAGNTFTNCTTALYIERGNNLDIFDNEIYNCTTGIYFFNTDTNNIFSNEIYNCMYPMSITSSFGMTIRDNYIHNNSNTGSSKRCVYFGNLDNSQVYNNTIETYTVSSSSQCNLLHITNACDGLEIFNNTLLTLSAPDSWSFAVYMTGSNHNFHDNTIANLNAGGMYVQSANVFQTNFYIVNNEFTNFSRNQGIRLYVQNMADLPYFEVRDNDIYDFGGVGTTYGMYYRYLGNYKITDNNIASSRASTRGVQIDDCIPDNFSNNTIETINFHFDMTGTSTNNFTAINCTCDTSSYTMLVNGMKLSFGYHLSVNTTDLSGPLPLVNVTLKNGLSQVVYTGISGMDGKIQCIPLINKSIVRSGGYITSYFDPYNITGEQNGFDGYCSYEPTMNRSRFIDLYFDTNMVPFPAKNLNAESYLTDVNLTWEGSISPDLDYYLIYRKGSGGGWIEVYNSTSDPPTQKWTNWTDVGAASTWDTYWYKVLAVDTTVIPSSDSNIVKCGDWAIIATQTISDQIIHINGSILVYPGVEVTFQNVSITFNCSVNSEYGIEVKDGSKLYLIDGDDNNVTTSDRSNFSGVGSTKKFFFIIKGEDSVIKNSQLSYCGGIQVLGSNITMENNEIDNSTGLIYLVSSTNSSIIGNTFYDSSGGMNLNGGNNNTLSNNTIIGGSGNRIYLTNSENNTFMNFIIHNIPSSGTGIRLDGAGCKNNIFTDIEIIEGGKGIYLYQTGKDNVLTNITIKDVSAGVDIRDTHYNYLNNIYIDNLTSDAYYIRDSSNIIIDGGHIDTCDHGFYYVDSHDISVSGIDILHSSDYSIYVLWCYDLSWSDSIINTTEIAINSYECDKVLLNNITIEECEYGLWIEKHWAAGSMFVELKNGVIKNAQFDAVYLYNCDEFHAYNSKFNATDLQVYAYVDDSASFDAIIKFFNTTYNESLMDLDTEIVFHVYWQLDLYVIDWSGSPSPGASAQIYDIYGTREYLGLTDSFGWAHEIYLRDRVYYETFTFNESYNPKQIEVTHGAHSGSKEIYMNETRTATVHLDNQLPVASNVFIVPSNPTTTDDFNITYSYWDPDFDPEGDTIIKWYINGTYNATFDNVTDISSSYTSKGQKWECEITPHDGMQYGIAVMSLPVIIQNTPPVVSNVEILEVGPTSSEDLNVNYSYYDIDGDAEVNSLCQWWFNNGSGWTYSGVDNPTLSWEHTKKGEQWRCNVTPGDWEDYGDPMDSNVVVIQNSAPEVSDVIILPGLPTSDDTLDANYSYFDIDSDLETGSLIRWYKDGIMQTDLNDSTSVDFTLTQKGDSWYYTVTPYDGVDYGNLAQSAEIVIGNTPPVTFNITISPVIPTTLDNLIVNYTFYDSDGDNESLNTIIKWLRWDGLEFFDTGYRGRTLSSDYVQKGEVWTVEVIPHDGYGEGAANRSDMNVTIMNSQPEILSAYVEPIKATSDSDLTAEYTYDDPDSDPMSGIIIQWYRNGMEQVSLNGSLTVDSSWTLKDDVWYFIITPSDGEDFGTPFESDPLTIGNTPPSVGNIIISPSSPTTLDDLTVTYDYYDSDGDSESLDTVIRWLLWSGIEFFDTGLRGQTLSYSNTARNEVWMCEVIPHDGTDNGGATSSINNVTISNSPPEILEAYITPENPTSDSDLSATYDYWDVDSDSESGSTIIWYRNELMQGDLNGSLTVNQSRTLKGEVWYYIITPYDGQDWGLAVQSENITVGNTPPTVSNIVISPLDPTAEDDLVVDYDFHDTDGDGESLDTTIKWLKWTGSDFEDSGYRGTILSSAYTSKNDLWTCEVRPHDGVDEGTPVLSSVIVTVTNSAPTASNAQITPAAPRTGSDLTAVYEYSDLDGDVESGTEIRWYRDGIYMSALDDQLIVPYNESLKGQVWNFSVRPNDGDNLGQLVESESITIRNTPPTAVDVFIIPNFPSGEDNLTAIYSFYDADGDSQQTPRIRWYKNGILQALYNDYLVVDSSVTAKGELWYYTVNVNDGDDFGEDVNSNYVVIENSRPIINSLTPFSNQVTIYETESQVFSVDVYDPDGDFLLFKWKLDKQTVEDDEEYSFETGYNSAGTYTLNLTVQDVGDNSFTEAYEWEITVVDVNLPPQIEVIEPTVNNPRIKEGDSLKFIIDESDPDSEDAPQVTWYFDGGVAQSGGSSYTYVADDMASGNHEVKAVVNDSLDSTEYVWDLNVQDVVAEELLGLSYDFWGLILAIISGLVAILLFVIGLIRVKKRKGALKKYMTDIDELDTVKEEDAVEYDNRLNELEAQIHDEFKQGNIEDLHFLMLKEILTTKRGEARKAEITQKFDRLPEGVVKDLDEMLKDGKISRGEYEGFVTTISKSPTLSPYEKKELSKMIGEWKEEDGELHEGDHPSEDDASREKKSEDEIEDLLDSLEEE